MTRGGSGARDVRRTITLRAAGDADIGAIAAIERASFGDPWSPASFRSLLGNPHVHFAVAVDAERVLGYAVVWYVLDEGEIANIAVVPEARGLGIGAMLLDASLGAAARRGVASVFLEVRDSNARARALYASRGFVDVGRRRGYYRKPVEDAVVMRKDLTPHDDRA